MADATARDVGERGLIAAICARLSSGPGVLVGPGDDAALVSSPDGRVVVTTDVLVEGVHFRRDWSSGYDVGRKAAAANLADVAAMGAVGTALVVGLAAPPDLALDWLLAVADGLRDEAGRVGASLVGGDVAGAPVLVISVAALGDLQGRPPVLRTGARVGDEVVAAGRLGWSAAGLQLLETGISDGVLVAAHRRPQPPYDLGPVLARLGATAMCDVSDGLLADLGHLAAGSGVAMEIDADALAPGPELRAAAVQLGADPLDWVLGGGEDHALVATVPAGTGLPAGVFVIGRVCEGSEVRVTGHPGPAARGWEHYR